MFRFAFLLLAGCTAVYCFQSNANPADSERDKDVYAIYSLMLTDPKTSHGPDNNERLLIAGATAIGHQEPCVAAPKQRETEFREVLADYKNRKAKPRELKPTFSIPKPFLLLSPADVAAFMKDRWLTPEPRVADERFRGASDVFTLSDVYFNGRRTLALTGISSWCGSLCALFQWKVFEKLNSGKWEERPWTTCFTIAGITLEGVPAASGGVPLLVEGW